jgi:hypothetical protein
MSLLKRLLRPPNAVEHYTQKTFLAIRDGDFSAVESRDLAQYAASIRLTISERQQCHRDAIQRLVRSLIAKPNGMSTADESNLAVIMADLGVRTLGEIPGLVEEFHAARLSAKVMQGDLPILDKARLPAQIRPSDVAHFCYPVYTVKYLKRKSGNQVWEEAVVDKRGNIILAKSGLYLHFVPDKLTYKLWKDVDVVVDTLYFAGRAKPIVLHSEITETFEYLDIVADFYGNRTYFED